MRGKPGAFFRKYNVGSESGYYLGVGWLSAAVFTLLWWCALRSFSGVRESCPALYDWSPAAHQYQPDEGADFYHYFIYASMFGGFWAGVTAAGMRTYSDLSSWAAGGEERRQLQGFFLWCVLGWAVQYRISQWILLPSYRTFQEWATWSSLEFLYVVVSSFWVLAFVDSLRDKKPRNWWAAVWQVYWRNWLIYILTVVTFFWLILYVIMPLVAPTVYPECVWPGLGCSGGYATLADVRGRKS